MRKARSNVQRSNRWIMSHWQLIAWYSAAGTAAWLVGLGIQTALVEGVDFGKLAAYAIQFVPTQVLYYKLIRVFVVKGEHHHWRKSFFRLVVVNAIQLASGAGLYQLFLLMFPYIVALIFASVVLTVPFFIIKITKEGVFKRPVEVEAMA